MPNCIAKEIPISTTTQTFLLGLEKKGQAVSQYDGDDDVTLAAVVRASLRGLREEVREGGSLGLNPPIFPQKRKRCSKVCDSMHNRAAPNFWGLNFQWPFLRLAQIPKFN